MAIAAARVQLMGRPARLLGSIVNSGEAQAYASNRSPVDPEPPVPAIPTWRTFRVSQHCDNLVQVAVSRAMANVYQGTFVFYVFQLLRKQVYECL